MNNIEAKRKEFLEFISEMVIYWDELPSDKTQKERLEGMAFSILSHIDGSSGDVHKLIPATETRRGSEFYLENNIAGWLHDYFYLVHRENEEKRKSK